MHSKVVCRPFFLERKKALDDCCDVQRRGGRSSGDVQVLRLDDDGQGSRTEYMKVMITRWQSSILSGAIIQNECPVGMPQDI